MPARVYVALDLETTGLDADQDAIIEIGAVKFTTERVLERFATLVNPQRPIPPRITQITGIRNEDVAHAPTLDRVLPELRAFVDAEVYAVVAHNTGFDLGFLAAAGLRFQRPAYDTVELAQILIPGEASYNLGELCLRLDIPLSDAHRATGDAEATAQLFRTLRRRLLQLPLPILHLIAESSEGSAWSLATLFAEAAMELGAGENAQSGQGVIALPAAPAFDSTAAERCALAPGPSTEAVAISPHLIERIFAENGPLHRLLGDRFEHRAGQTAMAMQVAEAFNRGDHLLIEAGTGTGKSLAYLLPAALWAIANDTRVVVATNTINLQEQLLEKDLPQTAALLAELGLPPLRSALLKGREHYLCTRRFHEWRTGHRLSPTELTVLAKVLAWLPLTQTGDEAELTLATAAERAIWKRICSDAGACSPERCNRPSHGAWLGLPDVDFYLEARRRSDCAHIMVVNHALLLADLAAERRILPSYTHLIVDETHRLEEAATDQFTYRIVWAEVRYALQQVMPGGELFEAVHRLAIERRHEAVLAQLPAVAASAQAGERRLHEFVSTLAAFARMHKQVRSDVGYAQRLALDGRVRSQPMWSRVEIECDSLIHVLRRLVNALSAVADMLDAAQWRQSEGAYQRCADWRNLTDLLTELVKRLDELVLAPRGSEGNRVAWLEVSPEEKDDVVIAAAPRTVNDVIEKGMVHRCKSIVFTGATLRIGANFAYLRERLGLWDVKVASVDSPFDYRRSVLLYLPTDMPPPDDLRYQNMVEQAVMTAAISCRGRTLALFTSHQQVRVTAEAIRAALERLGIAVLQHGQGSRSRLLREFRMADQALLLGTRSFWEGVDLPGDEVRCLLIARLPFAVPGDPMVAARGADFEDPFNDYMVPDAVLRFRQGFGRLIRRAGDRGVVVLLDSRIWRKAYGQTFLDSLPECTLRRAPLSNLAGAIETWFNLTHE
ncbi:MAG: exonuclease domain-containing protein [Caldilinea sp.]|nr:exonuclease domain-containing protein [Caldilinea sp.]MDW8441827.1 helicase C-terminal domain-containing protein [Caldilineaceae bacterium]